MKFLDEDITLKFEGLTPKQYYIYYIRLFDNEDGDWKDMFVGSAYALSDSLEIDITEILSNYRYTYKFFSLAQQTDSLISNIRVSMNNEDQDIQVAMVYRYPTKNYELYLNNLTDAIIPMIQGTYKISDSIYASKYLPKIPYGMKFPFIYYISKDKHLNEDRIDYYIDNQLLTSFDTYTGGNINNINVSLNGDYLRCTDDSLAVHYYIARITDYEGDPEILKNNLMNTYDLTENQAINLINNIPANIPIKFEDYTEYDILLREFKDATEGVMVQTIEEDTYHFIDIAEIDKCPSRYYLIWEDRFGGMQCQPFEGQDTYSESISNIEIQNYAGHKRKASITVEESFNLNTKWLTDDLYPIYEGILISPRLMLYDTQLDKYFPVISIEDSYTEKTFKNQKGFFNMGITVNIDKNQLIWN